MKNMMSYPTKGKYNFGEFLITTFKFSEDELAAIDKEKLITMEIFFFMPG